MKRSASSLLTSVDELFTTQQERDEAQLEKVQRIPLAELRPFKDHPFKVQNNEEMERIGGRPLPRSGPAAGGWRL